MKIIFSPSVVPAFNLAAEEYLLLQKNDNYLLLYANEPSVIIGSNQAVMREVDLDFCNRNNIRVVRRISGGGAVYHDLGNLNYCFISDKPADKLPVNADFLVPVVDVLLSLQIPVEIGKRRDLWLPDGYKISGTASHISKNRAMYHGTLLYDSNLDNLQCALSPTSRNESKKATASVPSPVKNMKFLVKQDIETDSFFALLTEKLKEYYQVSDLSVFSDADMEKINALAAEKYAQNAWNFRM